MIFDFSREVKTLTSERERKEAMIDHIVRPEVEKAIRGGQVSIRRILY